MINTNEIGGENILSWCNSFCLDGSDFVDDDEDLVGVFVLFVVIFPTGSISLSLTLLLDGDFDLVRLIFWFLFILKHCCLRSLFADKGLKWMGKDMNTGNNTDCLHLFESTFFRYDFLDLIKSQQKPTKQTQNNQIPRKLFYELSGLFASLIKWPICGEESPKKLELGLKAGGKGGELVSFVRFGDGTVGLGLELVDETELELEFRTVL
jgi:hypothetical protein